MIAISDEIQVRKDAPSGTIILNRPHRRNALTRELLAALQQAFEDLYQETNVRSVIITGAGNAFCSGTDLAQLQESANEANVLDQWREDAVRYQELLEYMLRYPKPIIAAVNGWVVGSGVGLMLASDIAIASDQARLMLPEARRGLHAGPTAPLLAFRIGASQAAHLLLSSRSVDASTAQQWGLFHEIVPDELVWVHAQKMAQDCAAGAPQSQLLTKQMLNETVGESLFRQLSIAAASMATARTTESAAEGITAFLEKRDPEF